MMGDGVKLRAGVAADEAEIKGLIKEYGLNPLGLDWRRFLVAVDGAGNFVGCGQLKPHGDGSLELASLAVVWGWRGKGVGRLLMEGLMGRGERPLWLMCEATRKVYYEKYGFVQVTDGGEMPKYFRRMWRVFRLFSWLVPRDKGLTIMVWR